VKPARVVIGLLALGLALAAPRPGAAQGDDHRGTGVSSATPTAITGTLADSIRYTVRVADNNLMGVTVTNYGFIGNNFVSRTPSWEYPLGTGYEHIVRGGLWIGARALDDSGAFVGVVTGTVDGQQGSSSQQATEFTPAGLEIKVRSTLPNSKFFSKSAVSEQDFITEYSDRPARRTDNNQEGHRPMNILVHQENYAWSFSDYQHVLIYHFVIRNLGPPLADAWVGIYSEMASGPKNSYTVWPPSSSGSTIGSWFNKKWIEYDDSLHMVREHYCNGLPIPSGCFLERVPEWVGIKVLGTHPEPLSTKGVTLTAWTYSPNNAARDEDVERYALMSADTIQDLSPPELQPQSGDPVTLISTGPFAQINNGDSIVVDFALVGGDGLTDPSKIREHAAFAQRAFDRDYVVQVPPPSPLLKVVARNQALDLYWENSPEAFVDSTGPHPLDFEGYRIYVGEDRNHLERIGQFDLAIPPNDTTGFNTGLDAVRRDTTIDGVAYHYRYTIPALRNGFKYFVAVTAYDLGNTEIESLESGISQNKTLAIPNPAPGEKASDKVYVYPNPYRVEALWDRGQQVRDHYLWFTNLPPHCMVRIYTLSGDLIYENEFVGTSYQGGGARGVYDPARELDVGPPTMSGTSLAWNLITRQGQAAATGLYMYSVENLNGGTKTLGKFLIVKSDREGIN
jgi:hypothetical protein